MTGKNPSFNEKLDTMFLISVPSAEDRGEDSYCCAAREDSVVAGVFDGCGGLGARLYPRLQGHTGAYVAARLVSGAVYDWYNDHSDHIEAADAVTQQLRGYIMNAFRVSAPYTEGTLKIRGSMVRDFPTTAAIALVENCADGVLLNAVWAGDSRVYIMDTQGLAQITEDDLEGEDALSNLSHDGELTNVISSDGKYELHSKSCRLSGPVMIFAATDGCFGYLPTPMDFENAILDSLIRSETPEDFRGRLKAVLSADAGDDLAFVFTAFRFGDFNELKNRMRKRYHELNAEYLQPLKNDWNQAAVESVWARYRVNYERFLR